jgi:hypothetical protein
VSDGPVDRTGRWAGVAWAALVFAGLAVYELFHQPGLLALTVSLKFGWADARTAGWLRRRDPDRRRGAAHAWAYLGFALAKVAAVGGAIGFAVPVLHELVAGGGKLNPNGPNNATFALFTGACLTGLFGFLLSAGVTTVALVQGRRAGLKLWVNSAVATARRRDEWPPDYGAANRLELIALPSALAVTGTAFGLAVGLAAVVLDQLGLGFPPAAAAAVMVALLLGLPVAALLLYDGIRSRLVAASPFEAWPDGPAGCR